MPVIQREEPVFVSNGPAFRYCPRELYTLAPTSPLQLPQRLQYLGGVRNKGTPVHRNRHRGLLLSRHEPQDPHGVPGWHVISRREPRTRPGQGAHPVGHVKEATEIRVCRPDGDGEQQQVRRADAVSNLGEGRTGGEFVVLLDFFAALALITLH